MHKLCTFPVASSSSSSSFCCGVSVVLGSNDKARDNNSWKFGLGLGLGGGGCCCCCCFRSVPVGSSWNSKSGSSCSSNSITTTRTCVITNFSQRKRWKSEPLVKGKVTRRALHIIKEIRGLEYQTDDVLERVLRKWVRTMTPGRRELLDMLKEFDNADDRELYYKVRIVAHTLVAQRERERDTHTHRLGFECCSTVAMYESLNRVSLGVADL